VRNCAILLIPYIAIFGFGLANIKSSYIRNVSLSILILIGCYFTLYGISVDDAKAGRTIENWKAVASFINTIHDCPNVYVHHSSYRDGLYYYIRDLEKIRGLSEQQAIEGPVDKRFLLIVVNHSLQPIGEKISREIIFLKKDTKTDLMLLKKIAETYIYICERN
jgi:hypothetical protein